jgi:hypothetical protein
MVVVKKLFLVFLRYAQDEAFGSRNAMNFGSELQEVWVIKLSQLVRPLSDDPFHELWK